jgi:hypothetical protein
VRAAHHVSLDQSIHGGVSGVSAPRHDAHRNARTAPDPAAVQDVAAAPNTLLRRHRILPNQSPPNKPGHADAVDRWDACKTTLIKSADAVERRDACKITVKSSSALLLCSPKKSSTALSCERWDINKKSPTSFSSSTSSCPTSRGSSWSSGEHWDAHQKQAHRPQQADGDGNDDDSEDDVQSSAGSNDMEMEVDDEPQQK